MNIPNATPQTLEQQQPAKQVEPDMNIVAAYLMDGVIEKKYTNNRGWEIEFQVPTQGQLMHASEEIDREVYAEDANISLDRVQLIRNNNMIALYTRKLNEHNYLEEQKDEFYTKEGFLKRKEALAGNKGLNAFAMEWAVRRLTDFQQEVSEAFEDKNLKNS